ncbi:LytR/AlgR family response regulator transcription factor [Chitinophaga tropicalis]|uniref:Response regulator n=1 Tax=Chitinophaga tropicalis TaxID=2683588 RepID=A0A7K1UE40_9BACT|nr:LytTR family DNA-binding domain-containing protein [Chitinophaga tropicalis]MVT12548.1 response regulator [Chitinophaga tropicalis]
MIDKILIIEDEKPNADRLKRLIKAIRPRAVVLSVLDSITDSIAWFAGNETPDVVMMDVRLSDGLSFEIFDRIEITCPIIFTTAYDEYAVRAFKYNSLDYLLKPVEQEELEAAFGKLERLSLVEQKKSIEGLLNFLQPKEYRSRFLLPYRDGYKTVLVSDVAYFYSEMKITRARLYNGMEEIVPQTMEELESQLNPRQFFRANRQFIIHVDAIEQIHNYFNGKLKVIIRKNENVEVIVSRDKANALKSWMDF